VESGDVRSERRRKWKWGWGGRNQVRPRLIRNQEAEKEAFQKHLHETSPKLNIIGGRMIKTGEKSSNNEVGRMGGIMFKIKRFIVERKKMHNFENRGSARQQGGSILREHGRKGGTKRKNGRMTEISQLRTQGGNCGQRT